MTEGVVVQDDILANAAPVMLSAATRRLRASAGEHPRAAVKKILRFAQDDKEAIAQDNKGGNRSG
jgi:hypothetical protein